MKVTLEFPISEEVSETLWLVKTESDGDLWLWEAEKKGCLTLVGESHEDGRLLKHYSTEQKLDFLRILIRRDGKPVLRRFTMEELQAG